MQNMFELKQAGKERGDSTAPYAITLDKQYTVREFIDTVLKRTDEWGYIGIEDHRNWSNGTPNCKYSYTKLITHMPEEVMDKPVESVTADGGWSRMDYKLTLRAKAEN